MYFSRLYIIYSTILALNYKMSEIIRKSTSYSKKHNSIVLCKNNTWKHQIQQIQNGQPMTCAWVYPPSCLAQDAVSISTLSSRGWETEGLRSAPSLLTDVVCSAPYPTAEKRDVLGARCSTLPHMGWAPTEVFTGMVEHSHLYTNSWPKQITMSSLFISTEWLKTEWLSVLKDYITVGNYTPLLTGERTLKNLTCLCLQCKHSHIKRQTPIQN